MSESKFTPGPWRIVPPVRIYDDSTRIEDAEGEKVVCVCADDTAEIDDGAIAEVLSPKAKANAALIASAPDLYAALKALLADANRIGKRVAFPLESRTAAREALAKAEGREP